MSISSRNAGRMLNVNGSRRFIWKTSGRHETCGHTSMPSARAAVFASMIFSCHGKPLTVSSAVQVSGRPIAALDLVHVGVRDLLARQQRGDALAGVAQRLEQRGAARRGPASRDGTGRPRSPLCVVDDDVANPAAPAASASAMTCCMPRISSSVASRS